MKAKLVEIARGMMDTGNFRLLPEFQRKYDESYGEDLLRRIGSTPSYDEIISKYKEDRDLGRHAGAGSRKYDDELFGEQETNIDDNVELEGQEINIEEIAFDINDIEDLNTSIELEEVASTFDQKNSHLKLNLKMEELLQELSQLAYHPLKEKPTLLKKKQEQTPFPLKLLHFPHLFLNMS